MTSFTLWIVLGAAAFAMGANLWRARRVRNPYGTAFHLLIAVTSAYFTAIFGLALAGVLDQATFGPAYARPATIVLLFLLGASAIAYPGGENEQ